jgi:hypothetical protein
VRLAHEEGLKHGWEKTGKSSTWEFCRYLKARQEFAYLDADDVLKKLSTLIELGDGEQIEIADEWDEIEFAAGMGILDWAVRMGLEHPLDDPPGPKLRLYVEFVSIAARLQVMRGNKPILLPLVALAEKLRTTPQVVSRLRKLAKKYGLLSEIAPYRMKQRATQFRFAIEKFPELKERQ